ncbi:hypothetical protein OPV22_016826 [Ensete ventricosum]|uniref:Uncharacterized protein n=1 Tax=Ensete ventricosum TaxID=4639 RepID=A0AAV8PH75_ENSVE|nr:hypothetical protein OPV22_016826 [Ensete ventricosum]
MEDLSPCCAAASKARHVPVHPDEYILLRRQAESWRRGYTGNVHLMLMLMAFPHCPDVLFQGLVSCPLTYARQSWGNSVLITGGDSMAATRTGKKKAKKKSTSKINCCGIITAPQQGPIKPGRPLKVAVVEQLKEEQVSKEEEEAESKKKKVSTGVKEEEKRTKNMSKTNEKNKEEESPAS